MYQIGELVIGKVINVKPYAAFLQFDNATQGLLHISEISDSYIRDIDRFVSLGDELRVKILKIDEINGFMRVSLKQVEEKDFFSTHQNIHRTANEVLKVDFSPLKERLDDWINEAKERMKEGK